MKRWSRRRGERRGGSGRKAFQRHAVLLAVRSPDCSPIRVKSSGTLFCANRAIQATANPTSELGKSEIMRRRPQQGLSLNPPVGRKARIQGFTHLILRNLVDPLGKIA